MPTPIYEVAVETGDLGFEKAGPLFERYVVRLVGQMDRRWVDAYGKIVKDRPNLARYRLEPGAATVSFTCRATDGPAEVQGVLGRLKEMLVLVNQTATAAAGAEVEGAKKPSGAAPRSPARADETAVGRLASMTSGLFARFSKANPAPPAAAPNGRSK